MREVGLNFNLMSQLFKYLFQSNSYKSNCHHLFTLAYLITLRCFFLLHSFFSLMYLVILIEARNTYLIIFTMKKLLINRQENCYRFLLYFIFYLFFSVYFVLTIYYPSYGRLVLGGIRTLISTIKKIKNKIRNLNFFT